MREPIVVHEETYERRCREGWMGSYCGHAYRHYAKLHARLYSPARRWQAWCEWLQQLSVVTGPGMSFPVKGRRAHGQLCAGEFAGRLVVGWSAHLCGAHSGALLCDGLRDCVMSGVVCLVYCSLSAWSSGKVQYAGRRNVLWPALTCVLPVVWPCCITLHQALSAFR